MIVIIVILCIVIAVMVTYLVLQRIELKQLKIELKEIVDNESNQKLHSRTGSVDRELINEINQMLEIVNNFRIHYNRKNHEIEQMMTNISHDLRTPLTSALGYIEMLENNDMSQEEREEALHVIGMRMRRLKELIDAFFEFSMAISKNEKPEMTEINLVAILQECIVHYYDDYCDQNRSIEFNCEFNKLKIHSNQNMMMRIFDNLISNALKHGYGNLSITVLANEEKKIELIFKNEMIDQNIDINRVFDEFYTTEISRTKGNTGLGLAIVKQFSQMIGWSISAEEKDGSMVIRLVIN